MPRGRVKGEAGTQREFFIQVRFRVQVKEKIVGKLGWLEANKPQRTKKGKVIPWTLSALVREAVWEYCKGHSDPRTP